MDANAEPQSVHFGNWPAMADEEATGTLKPAKLEDFELEEFLDSINGADSDTAGIGELPTDLPSSLASV